MASKGDRPPQQKDSHAMLLSMLRLTLQRCLVATCTRQWCERVTQATIEEHRVFAERSAAEANRKPKHETHRDEYFNQTKVQQVPTELLQSDPSSTLPIWSQVEVFGSRALEGHLPGGDIDCVMFVPSYCSFDMFASFCDVYLPLAGFTVKAKVQLARVPLIKVEFGPWELDLLQVDMNLVIAPTQQQLLQTGIFDKVTIPTRPSLNGLRTVLLLKQMVPYAQDIYGAVLKAVKQWSIGRRIYGTVFGYPGGVGLAVLVARCCIDHYEKVALEAAIRQPIEATNDVAFCDRFVRKRLNRIWCGESGKVGLSVVNAKQQQRRAEFQCSYSQPGTRKKVQKQKKGAMTKNNNVENSDSSEGEQQQQQEEKEEEEMVVDEVATWPKEVIIDSCILHFFDLYSDYFSRIISPEKTNAHQTSSLMTETGGGKFNASKNVTSRDITPIFVTKNYDPERMLDKKKGEWYNRTIENMQDCWGTNSAHYSEKVVVLNPAYPYINTTYGVGSSGVEVWEEETTMTALRVRAQLNTARKEGGARSKKTEENEEVGDEEGQPHPLDVGRELKTQFENLGKRPDISALCTGQTLYQELISQNTQHQLEQIATIRHGDGRPQVPWSGRYRLVSVEYAVPVSNEQKVWEYTGYAESKFKYFVYTLEHSLAQLSGGKKQNSPQMRVWPKRYHPATISSSSASSLGGSSSSSSKVGGGTETGREQQRVQYFVLLSNCGRSRFDELDSVGRERDRWLTEALQRACLEWAFTVKASLGDGYAATFLEGSFKARLGQGTVVEELVQAEESSPGAEKVAVSSSLRLKSENPPTERQKRERDIE